MPALPQLSSLLIGVGAVSRRLPRTLVDPLMALALCVLDLGISFDARAVGARSLTVTAAYAAAGYAVLSFRRRWPGPVFVAMLVHSLVAGALLPGYLPTLGLWLALYTLAVRCERRWAVLGLLSMSAHTAFNVADELDRHPGSDRTGAVVSAVVLTVGIASAIYAVGRWVRWSVRQRQVVAEHAAAEAVLSERSRIARDLHDVVAHSVTLMILQAGVAARVLASDPARAGVALEHVQDVGLQAVGELQRLLGVLDPEPAAASTTEMPSGLGDLTQLVDQVRAGGVDVRLRVSGEPADLDPGIDLSAFRIAQEALTNAARHADLRHPVEAEVSWRQVDVRIRVVNRRGPGRLRPLSGGRGLLGVRERVRVCGGNADIGPDADERFVVDVRLPLSLRGTAPSPPEPSAAEPGTARER